MQVRNLIRPAIVPYIAAAVGALSVFGYTYLTRSPAPHSASGEPSTLAAESASRSASAHEASPATDPRGQAPNLHLALEGAVDDDSAAVAAADEVSPTSDPRDVDQVIRDVRSDDAQTRATAIASLAEAPRSQAIPALKDVLHSGAPEAEREIAIRSLHALALKYGDDDGRIRDLLRTSIYHGSDAGVSLDAQALLDEIETAQSGGAAGESG